MSDPSEVEAPTQVLISDGVVDSDPTSSVSSPAKVLRVGSMIKGLLEEVRSFSPDETTRSRLKGIYQQSVEELASGLSPELADELKRLSFPFTDDEIPSESELRIAQAQLVGWLEGVFHGIQATLFAQQMAARTQLEEMRRGQLMPGESQDTHRPGTYL